MAMFFGKSASRSADPKRTYWEALAAEVRAEAEQIARAWLASDPSAVLLAECLETEKDDDARLRRLAELEGQGVGLVALVVRAAELRSAWLGHLLPPALQPALDSVALLRAIHLHTGYALKRRAECRRRGYPLLVLLLERRLERRRGAG